MSSYCPAALDCIWQQSCPAAVLPCPPGWLCGSYAGSPYADALDFQYATESQSKNDVDVTPANYKLFIEKGRYVQTTCLAGYYCRDSLTIDQCGVGNWCSEVPRVPRSLSSLSRMRLDLTNLLLAPVVDDPAT